MISISRLLSVEKRGGWSFFKDCLIRIVTFLVAKPKQNHKRDVFGLPKEQKTIKYSHLPTGHYPLLINFVPPFQGTHAGTRHFTCTPAPPTQTQRIGDTWSASATPPSHFGFIQKVPIFVFIYPFFQVKFSGNHKNSQSLRKKCKSKWSFPEIGVKIAWKWVKTEENVSLFWIFIQWKISIFRIKS